MKIELLGKENRFKCNGTSWRYIITGSNVSKKYLVTEKISSLPDFKERIRGWENLSEDEIWGKELGIGASLRHAPDEIALTWYFLYKAKELDSINQKNGLDYNVGIDDLMNSREANNLRKEMNLKRKKIILEESEKILESIRYLFIEKNPDNDSINSSELVSTRNNTIENSVSISSCFVLLFILFILPASFFLGFMFFLAKTLAFMKAKWIVKR